MEAVFDECGYLAQLTGATIHVAYIFDIDGVGAQPVHASWEETYVIIKAQARRILDVARGALAKEGGGRSLNHRRFARRAPGGRT